MKPQEHAQLLRELAELTHSYTCLYEGYVHPMAARAHAAAEEIEARQVVADGLHGKYIIRKASDDSPVQYPCFVLRIDGTDAAAMEALKTYAAETTNTQLGGDLMYLADHIHEITSRTVLARYGGGEVES